MTLEFDRERLADQNFENNFSTLWVDPIKISELLDKGVITGRARKDTLVRLICTPGNINQIVPYAKISEYLGYYYDVGSRSNTWISVHRARDKYFRGDAPFSGFRLMTIHDIGVAMIPEPESHFVQLPFLRVDVPPKISEYPMWLKPYFALSKRFSVRGEKLSYLVTPYLRSLLDKMIQNDSISIPPQSQMYVNTNNTWTIKSRLISGAEMAGVDIEIETDDGKYTLIDMRMSDFL